MKKKELKVTSDVVDAIRKQTRHYQILQRNISSMRSFFFDNKKLMIGSQNFVDTLDELQIMIEEKEHDLETYLPENQGN
jgi:hypothetical protein